jgi:hypothetical protein
MEMQKEFIWLSIEKIGGFSEQINEHSVYINGRKFLELLRDY